MIGMQQFQMHSLTILQYMVVFVGDGNDIHIFRFFRLQVKPVLVVDRYFERVFFHEKNLKGTGSERREATSDNHLTSQHGNIVGKGLMLAIGFDVFEQLAVQFLGAELHVVFQKGDQFVFTESIAGVVEHVG